LQEQASNHRKLRRLRIWLVSRQVSPYPDYMLFAGASQSWSKNNNTRK